MPTYVYECKDCGVKFERLQSYSDPTLKDCPECGGHVHRVIQPVGVIFKGYRLLCNRQQGQVLDGHPCGEEGRQHGCCASRYQHRDKSGEFDER